MCIYIYMYIYTYIYIYIHIYIYKYVSPRSSSGLAICSWPRAGPAATNSQLLADFVDFCASLTPRLESNKKEDDPSQIHHARPFESKLQGHSLLMSLLVCVPIPTTWLQERPLILLVHLHPLHLHPPHSGIRPFHQKLTCNTQLL